MYKVYIENNTTSEKLEFNSLNGEYTITEIQGLSPAEATINTDEVALMDGATFNSAKIGTRTIDIAFCINGNAEKGRLKAYKVLQPKKTVRFYYETSEISVFIDGIVKNIQVGHFDANQLITVTLLCLSPFFKNDEEVRDVLSNVRPMFHFPFPSDSTSLVFGVREALSNVVVTNKGTAETGLTIELYASGIVHNPKVYNYVTQEFIGLEGFLYAGDLITITTGVGEKSIKLTRNGVTSNAFNMIADGSSWLQLPVEGAVFVYTAESGFSSLTVTIKHYNLFEGV